MVVKPASPPEEAIRRVFTKYVGHEVSQDGKWLPFHGISIVAKPCGSAFLVVLEKVQEQLADKYSKYLLAIPLVFIRVEICKIWDQSRSCWYFKTTEQECGWISSCVKEGGVRFPAEVELTVSDVSFDGTDYWITFQDDEAARSYKDAHEACAKALDADPSDDICDTDDMSDAEGASYTEDTGDKEPFVLHIKIGYGIEVAPEDVLTDMRKIAAPLRGLVFKLLAPVVAKFDGMWGFKTVHQLEASSSATTDDGFVFV